MNMFSKIWKWFSSLWMKKGMETYGARTPKSEQWRRPSPTRHKLRGVGYTRKDKSVSKKRRKMTQESRRINRS